MTQTTRSKKRNVMTHFWSSGSVGCVDNGGNLIGINPVQHRVIGNIKASNKLLKGVNLAAGCLDLTLEHHTVSGPVRNKITSILHLLHRVSYESLNIGIMKNVA